MNKKLIKTPAEFEAWKAQQIQEYKQNYLEPVWHAVNGLELPQTFPVVVVFDDFNDADSGLFFFCEYVYQTDFN